MLGIVNISESCVDYDSAVWSAIVDEGHRQDRSIELIASENIVSKQVRSAQGSILTNKYAEGYPGARYYGGCVPSDRVERLAIERACRLFGATFANVQPHSGANANLAVLFALLEPGDTILGLDLACGGHLTHGARVSLSGRWFKAETYKVAIADERIDYDDLQEKRSEEHTSELQSLMRNSYAVFCLKTKKKHSNIQHEH